MKDMNVQAVTAAAQQESRKQPGSGPPAPADTETAASAASGYAAKESKSLTEMIQDAQEKAEVNRSALNISKSSARYSDAPLEAYARLARAKSVSEVNAASGYARRRMAQLKGVLHVDSENAAKIKAAIHQLQKAVNRGAKKKKELTREKLEEERKARSEAEQERMQLELSRRKIQRAVRESGYLQEAHVSGQLAAQFTATQVELRQQAQSAASTAGAAAADFAAQQYTATAAAAAAPVPAAEISVRG